MTLKGVLSVVDDREYRDRTEFKDTRRLFEYSFESIIAGGTKKSVDFAAKNTMTLKIATVAVTVPPPIKT